MAFAAELCGASSTATERIRAAPPREGKNLIFVVRRIRSRVANESDNIQSSFRGIRGIAAYNRDVPCVYLRFIMRAGRGARALARDIALKTGENEPDGRGCINE